ncbi:hypothetical protein O1R50_00400 [Glycomyces luteolus]|uniref:Uncharacterized protein n=1 Tax=Glycomyces luteolus TaxID=2670330 RepID=A0A9X3SPL9_9ACTN|nr:hypothetical protein [Glycomyces luteolus]MDA1358064.1 hypothetical protein [Glycomyces luteolus]
MGQVGQSGTGWAGAAIESASGLDPAAEREARAALAGWQQFARKYRLAFRAELQSEDLGGETAEVLDSLGRLGIPVARVRGWMYGAWGGRPSFGFSALDATAAGSIYQLRCNAMRLRRLGPDVVQHRLLDGDASMAGNWHPNRARYTTLVLPDLPRPQARPRGRIGRFTADALDRFFRPVPRQLHTDDPAYAAKVAATAEAAGLDLFRWSWAAKDGWLAVWKSDGNGADTHLQRARFMDFLPALADCLDKAALG